MDKDNKGVDNKRFLNIRKGDGYFVVIATDEISLIKKQRKSKINEIFRTHWQNTYY